VRTRLCVDGEIAWFFRPARAAFVVHGGAPMRNRSLAVVLAATIVVLPCAARADGGDGFWTVSPSLLIAVPMGAQNDHVGGGGEISLVHHPGGDERWSSLFCFDGCWGVFAQAESKSSVVDRDRHAFRAALGAQASYGPLVGELGPTIEMRPDGGRPFVGGAIGGALSMGWASIGARVTVLPGRSGDDGAVEGTLLLRTTIPFLLPLLVGRDAFEPALFSPKLGRFPM
jgi:hypothetical protein